MNEITTQQHHVPANQSGVTTDDRIVELFFRGKSPNTVIAYERSLKKFFAYVQKGIAEVTLADLSNYADEVRSTEAKPATVRAYVAPVKALLTFAWKSGYIPYNVGVSVALEQPESIIEEKLLSEDQLEEILKGLKDHSQDAWLLVYTLYATGARVSEFLDLRVCDFIPDSPKGPYFIFRLSTTKGNKTRRIAIPQFICDEIKRHIKEKGRKHKDFIFARKYRGGVDKYTRHAVNAILSRLAASQGLPKATPHMLRHSVATHALEAGMSIQEVSHKLGHSGVDITIKTYDHTDKSGAFKGGLL